MKMSHIAIFLGLTYFVVFFSYCEPIHTVKLKNDKTTAVSKIGQLFEESTIQYVFSKTPVEIDNFNNFVVAIAYSPILLEVIPYWITDLGRYNQQKLKTLTKKNRTVFLKMRFSYTNRILMVIDFESINKLWIVNIAGLLFQRMSYANEDPHYALFLLESLNDFEGKVINLIKYCSLSTTLLFLASNSLYTVCLTCHPESQFKDVFWARTSHQIRLEWMLQNQNFHKQSVRVVSRMRNGYNFDKVCGEQFISTGDSCAAAFLATYHNITESDQYYSNEKSVIVGLINTKIAMLKSNVENICLKQSLDRYVLEPYKIEQYQFIVVTLKPSNLKSFSALV